MKNKYLNVFGKDLLGGTSSAIVSLSGNIVFGIIAFSPLFTISHDFIAMGIMAGFYCSIIGGFTTTIAGGTPGMISGPRAPSTLVFSSVIIMLLSLDYLKSLYSNENLINVVIILAFLTVFLAGIIQTLFGIFRFGSLIKFISYPVIAGFLNGTAILIFITQFWAFLGIPEQESILDLFKVLDKIQPYTIYVAGFTAIIMWMLSGISKKIPGAIIALILGTGLYHAFALSGLSPELGPLIGKITVNIPTPEKFLDFFQIFTDPNMIMIVPYLIPAAFSIAILSSTDSLLTSISIQNITNRNPNTNRELVGQGLGNILSSVFGGIPCGGSITRSMVNIETGGRTRFSGIINTFIVILIIFTLSSYVKLIPKAVIAGIIIVITLKMINRWSFRLLKTIIFKKGYKRKDVVENFLIVLIVVLVTVFANLIAGVSIGIAISILTFVYKMSKSSVIRKEYSGAFVHSKKQRDERLMDILLKHGGLIRVLELEGSIFFASADSLQKRIEELIKSGTDYIILDLKRVNNIDSTGALILEQIYVKLKEQNKILTLSYIEENDPHWNFLSDLGFFLKADKKHIFNDTDYALEFFEDLILKMFWHRVQTKDKAQFAVLKNFSSNELSIFKKFLRKIQLKKGEPVFIQGDTDTAMFFLARGLADVLINLPDSDRKKRLQTISAGTFFGEMALLESKPRSANIIAKTDIICYSLDLNSFKKLQKEYPDISVKLVINISKTIANRLRFANITISELEL